jgi:protein TonB
LQCLVVAILLLIPLLHPENLRIPDPPKPHLIRTWINQPPIPPQRTNPHAATVTAPVAPRLVFVPPGVHPTAARSIDAPSADPELSIWSGPSTAPFGPSLAGTTVLPPRVEVKPPAVATNPKPAVTGPLKVGGGVQAARLLYGPRPVYPPLAKAARSQGVVRMEAIIAADGSIRNLRVVSGPPLLVDAALKAVEQWRYQPTLLNGVAVEVVTEIEVNFTLTN